VVRTDYRYTVCLFRTDGASLGEFGAEVDWMPAVEWGLLQGIRQGEVSPVLVAQAAIEPRWHPTAGQPRVNGLRVRVLQADGRQFCCEVATSYFASLARQAATALVQKGVLREGEHFRYFVGAYPLAEAGPQEAPAPGLDIEEVALPLTLKQSSLVDFARQSVRFGQPDPNGDIPVFLPQEVLDETAMLSRKAGAFETGGILIGYLHQDPTLRELFVEVTAQVPARHSRSELMRLTFTPDTWAAASASIKLRRRDEVQVGWWHSHSYLKQPNEADQPATGHADQVVATSGHAEAAFLSAEDVSLHRTCFPRAYSIALVVSEGQCTGLSWALFGWNAGLICPRGYHVLPGDGWLAGEFVSTSLGEDRHAQQ
jgi:hypothetical protein